MAEPLPAFKLTEKAPDHVVFGQGEAVEHADLKALLTLWSQKRGERKMPLRTDFTPHDMRAYLRRVHLYDVLDGGRDFRIRVMGTSLAIGLGSDPTGKLVTQYPDAAAGHRIRLILQHVVSIGRPVRVVADHLIPERLATLQTEALWLPLGEKSVEHVLAASIIALNRY
ncbi:MAG: PAS domain-containing protein [Alphaproteobacteria bacterium]